MSEDVTVVCKRLDYKGSAAFCEKVNGLFADGYTIVIGKTRTDAPRMAGQPQLTFRQTGEAAEGGNTSISQSSRNIISGLNEKVDPVVVPEPVEKVSEKASEAVSEEDKPKRTRRTKAQIAADKVKESEE